MNVPSHPFGDLLTQYRARKHGLSQARLAEAAGYDPSLIGRMARGTRDLTGPSGRERVLRLLAALRQFEAITTVDEANALLRAAALPPLFDGQPIEAALMGQLRVEAALVETAPARPEPVSDAPIIPSHNLPTPLTSFVGRDAELVELGTRLQRSRLLTLVGPGGAGKTRLAIELGRQAGAQFGASIWLITLAALTEPNLVAQKIAMTLNLRESDAESALATLIGHLRDQHALLILDNCEHLVDVCAATAEALLQNCPKLHIVATSREALNIAGEDVFSVPSLAFPGRNAEVTARSLADFAAAELFIARAQTASPAFRVTDPNAASIAHICRRLDGIPLAIELAASRIRVLALEQIAERLDDRFNLLTGGSRTALPRQQTLRATIDWSYDLLALEERNLLHSLSVFSGGWTLDAAEQVCAAPGCDGEAQLLEALMQLVNKSLVRATMNAGQTRYWLLETIRQYAREKLDHSGGLMAVHERHLHYFAQLAQVAEPHLRDGQQLIYLEQLETEHDNLRAALEWALRHSHEYAALTLTKHLARFWYLHGYLSEGRDWLRRALAQTTAEAAPADRARALQGLCWLLNEDPHEISLYEESLALCRHVGDTWGAAFALRGLGTAVSNQGDSQQANAYLSESLDLFRQTSDPWGIALALLALGWETTALGIGAADETPEQPPDQPTRIWSEALRGFKQIGDRWGIAVTLGSLSYWARRNADFKRATQLSAESLALFKTLGDKAGIAISLSRLAMVAYRRDDYPLMTSLIEESLVLQRELGYRGDVADSLEMLAVAALFQGDYAKASELGQQGLQLWREVGNVRGIVSLLDTLAGNAHLANQLDEAESLWQECLKLSRESSNKNDIAGSYHGLGDVALARGQLEQATIYLEQALEGYREGREKMHIANVEHSLGRALLAQGDLPRSRTLLAEALQLRHAISQQRGIAESLEDMAMLQAVEKQHEHAAMLLGHAQALRVRIGVPVPKLERSTIVQLRQTLQAQLGNAAFERAMADGATLALDAVVALATHEVKDV